MNIVNKLTWRHMRKNKRQTLVTIIGVIISVAMVTGVATLAFSFMDLMQKQNIAQQGEWHVQYHDVSDEQLVSIEADKQTKDVFLQRPIGYATLEDGQNDHKPYVHLVEFNDQAFEQYPIHLTEGRLPENEHEVLLSEHIEANGQVEYEIGDEITWEIGERVTDDPDLSDAHIDQSFGLLEADGEINETLEAEETRDVTDVGFIERPTWELSWAPGYTVISYLDETTITADQPVNAFVNVSKVNRSIYKNSETLADDLNIGSYDMHDSLLRYSFVISNDGMFYALFTFVAIIMAIIMVGSISLIYNAFAISVSERSRHLGMLSSVGATKKQKRNSVFFEGFIIALISIPIGIASGILGMAITFYFINDSISAMFEFSERLTVKVTPMSLILTSIVSLITIFISTYIPARRASRVSAIDAIRQSMDVKLTNKRVKTSKLVRKLFGFEAEIGLKNLKRNKKSYLATVVSLMISIVLLLLMSSFTTSCENVSDIIEQTRRYDSEMTIWSEDLSENDRSVIEEMKDLPDVTEASLMAEFYNLTSEVDLVHVPDALKENVDGDFGYEDTYPYYVTMYVLEDDVLAEFAKENNIRLEQLQSTDQMTAIVLDTAIYENASDRTYSEVPSIMINLGERIPLSADQYDQESEEETEIALGDIEIVGQTSTLPIGVGKTSAGGLKLIVSEATKGQMQEDIDDIFYSLYVSSTDPIQTGEEMADLSSDTMRVFNQYQANQEDKQMTFVMSVFIYGFITLITLISIANIFNTISTSISLRKREFGMLKSVGMTPKGFNKMIRYESIFYGIKALLYGLPISIFLMFLMHRALADGIIFKFMLPWAHIAGVIIAVFLIVGLSMMYSSSKMKKENIIDALKQDNV